MKKEKEPYFVLNLRSDILQENNRFFLESLFGEITNNKHICRAYFSESALYSLLSSWSALTDFILHPNFRGFVHRQHVNLMAPKLKVDLNPNLSLLSNRDFFEKLAKESQNKNSRVFNI